jgi:flagellin
MTRINTNVQSLIARRSLSSNNDSLEQALGRLSTGLRINSGKDDPAGLIASESLRANLNATAAAIDNATRADTIVAIAEGGLQEISSLLLELEGLVGRTANEGGLTDAEVAANQLQIDSILGSINRLAESVSFGDKQLLNGSYDFTTSGVNINESNGGTLDHLDRVQVNSAKIAAGSFRQVNVEVITPSTIGVVSATLAGTDSSNDPNGTLDQAVTIQIQGTLGTDIISFASGTTAANIVAAINASKSLTGVSATASAASGGPASVIFQSTGYGSDSFVSVSILDNVAALDIGGSTARAEGTDGTVTINGSNGIVKGLDVAVRTGSLSVDLTLTDTLNNTAGNTTSFEVTGGGGIFSIGPDVNLVSQESIGIKQVSTANLGTQGKGFLSSLQSGQANDLTSRNFTLAQRVVREAIDQIASMRGRLGAFQKNTLTTTINSLSVARENVTAAESAIRDADFAVETSQLTRAQILVNSSTVSLQLANAQPQNVLSLLG